MMSSPALALVNQIKKIHHDLKIQMIVCGRGGDILLDIISDEEHLPQLSVYRI